MGKCYNWIDKKPNKKVKDLINHLKSLGFLFEIEISNHFDIGETIIDHKEICDLTKYEWTGFFSGTTGSYHIMFKDESDSIAVKLVFG